MEEVLRKRYFKTISLLTIFTLVIYAISALTLVRSTAEAETLNKAKANIHQLVVASFSRTIDK